jgi:hypothetical protein
LSFQRTWNDKISQHDLSPRGYDGGPTTAAMARLRETTSDQLPAVHAALDLQRAIGKSARYSICSPSSRNAERAGNALACLKVEGEEHDRSRGSQPRHERVNKNDLADIAAATQRQRLVQE